MALRYIVYEGSTDKRSLSLFIDEEEIISVSSDDFRYSSFFAVQTEDVLNQYNLKVKDLTFLGVGTGPGSYTGLRTLYAFLYGLSTAAMIPIIPVDTLDALYYTYKEPHDYDYAYACIDARRNEAYRKVYDSSGNIVKDVEAVVFDEERMAEILSSNKKNIFIGNFNPKIDPYVTIGKVETKKSEFHSRNLSDLARKNFSEKKTIFGDFPSPLYFKGPKITTPRKKLF